MNLKTLALLFVVPLATNSLTVSQPNHKAYHESWSEEEHELYDDDHQRSSLDKHEPAHEVWKHEAARHEPAHKAARHEGF